MILSNTFPISFTRKPGMRAEAHQWQNMHNYSQLYYTLTVYRKGFTAQKTLVAVIYWTKVQGYRDFNSTLFYTYFILSFYYITVVQLLTCTCTVAHSNVAVSFFCSLNEWTPFSITTFEHMAVLYHIFMFIYKTVAIFMSHKIVKSELY